MLLGRIANLLSSAKYTRWQDSMLSIGRCGMATAKVIYSGHLEKRGNLEVADVLSERSYIRSWTDYVQCAPTLQTLLQCARTGKFVYFDEISSFSETVRAIRRG